MNRLLLRLLLIVSLVFNGVGTPWAAAKAPAASGSHDHAAMAHHASEGAASASDCHHGNSADLPAGMDHHSHGNAAGEPAADRACCGDAHCTCGCMLPPVLGRFAVTLPVLRWSLAPVAEPATRAVVRHMAPPFRPPAV
jgi:hypothetical protein